MSKMKYLKIFLKVYPNLIELTSTLPVNRQRVCHIRIVNVLFPLPDFLSNAWVKKKQQDHFCLWLMADCLWQDLPSAISYSPERVPLFFLQIYGKYLIFNNLFANFLG
ncbi:hypothetical protein C4569_03545 [Candidatus Parcubacteria bacterium]|nr:MAG: hypothetical protein C4569_03545 [Candidatus Parcubacteria bacterium]